MRYSAGRKLLWQQYKSKSLVGVFMLQKSVNGINWLSCLILGEIVLNTH